MTKKIAKRDKHSILTKPKAQVFVVNRTGHESLTYQEEWRGRNVYITLLEEKKQETPPAKLKTIEEALETETTKEFVDAFEEITG